MAMFSNFDGTMRKSIVIGRNGTSITSTGANDLAVSKKNPDGTTAAVRITNIAEPISDADAVNFAALKAKFGTNDDQVRNNLQLDGRYEQLGRKNIANGYVGLGADGKIESKFLPSIAINSVIVVKNKYARNKVTGLHTGDTCVIQGTPTYQPNVSYAKDTVVRIQNGTQMVFYSALKQTSAQAFDVSKWNSTTVSINVSYPQNTVVLYQGVPYISKVAGATVAALDDITSSTQFERYAGAEYPEFKLATQYLFQTIVKHTVGSTVTFYSANTNIPAMDPAQWTGTTIKPTTAYVVGDEVLFNNANYIVVADHTSDAAPDPTQPSQAANYLLDSEPDAGMYILTRNPTGVAGATVDADWAAVGVGLTVESFNGRSGTVTSQSGDYMAFQVNSVPYADNHTTTVQAGLNLLTDTRVKKSGDTMTGALVIDDGAVDAPALVLPSSSKTGVYDDGGRWAVTFEGVSKWSVGANVDVRTNMFMNNNVIKQLAEPQDSGDAATKNYVDLQPTILRGSVSPTGSVGADGDVYLTVVDEGAITLPSTQQWVDGTTDGIRTIFINTNAIPVAAVTTDGAITWSNSNMPAASASAGDQYSYIISNNTDNFVAIRRIIDMTKSTGKIVYTVDGGKTWNQSSKFTGSGSFIPASSAHDGSPYMLVPLANSNKVYTSNTGDSWDENILPYSTTWADAAGARGTFVLVARDAAGTNKIVYQEFGGAWQQSTAATTQVWNAIGTTDGVNFVLVGEKVGAAKDTNIANYSTDRGATWTATTLPSAGRWTCIGSNGTTMVTLRSGSNQGAYSTDNGKTWSAITLPSTRGWSGVFASSRAYYAIANDTTTNSPLAISTDGGRTWTSNVTGQITALGVKQNGKWLNYSGMDGVDGSGVSVVNRFVRRDGDKMTGALVISHDPSKESLTASGAVSSPSLVARKFAAQDAAIKTTGTIYVGSSNSDSAAEGKVFGYHVQSEGNMPNGFALKVKANTYKAAGSTVTEIMNISDSQMNVVGNVGIGGIAEASSKAAVMVNLDKTPHGVVFHHGVVDSSSEPKAAYPVLTLVGAAKGAGKLFVVKGGALDRTYDSNEATPYASTQNVFTVDDQGIVDASTALRVGYDTRGNDYPLGRIQIVNDANMAIKHGIYVEQATPYAMNSAGLTMKHGSGWQPNVHHIQVFEDNIEVLGLNAVSMRTSKNIVQKSTAPKNVSFYTGATDAMKIPAGTEAQRPQPADCEPGMIRYNSTSKRYEAYVEVFGWTPMDIGVFAFNRKVESSEWKVIPAVAPANEPALNVAAIDPDLVGMTHYIKILATEHKLSGNINATFQTVLANGMLKGTNYDYIMTPTGDVYVYALQKLASSSPDAYPYVDPRDAITLAPVIVYLYI